MSDTLSIVQPIVVSTYGKGSMVTSLAARLAEKIDAFEQHTDRDTRERMIWETCWNWMPGGTTAQSVATKIEAALDAAQGAAR